MTNMVDPEFYIGVGEIDIAYKKVSISLPNIICFLNFRIFQPIWDFPRTQFLGASLQPLKNCEKMNLIRDTFIKPGELIVP